MAEKLLYSTTEAKAALGIANSKFWALVKEGAFVTRKMGARTYVEAESLKAFVAALPR